jgi:hypothetical protein
MGTEELGLLKKTNGLVVVAFTLVAVVATLTLFSLRRPSPFSSGSGFGTGWGSQSVMFGASAKPRLVSPRLISN